MKKSRKKALITGIAGQDGSYLAELLLSKGYEVHGIVKRSSLENQAELANITHLLNKVTIHTCLIDNHLSVYKLISELVPDECYHLAASSFVNYSFEDELSVMSTNFNSTLYFLSSIKELAPLCHFYFAGSSEMFGEAERSPQDENCKFNPRSAYGISKLASYYCVKNYRDHHGLYACTGISYNHESPRRGLSFVTRKITHGVAKIYLGLEKSIEIGNIEPIRDWGYAPEYVEAMWRMLNNDKGPRDYVLATGQGTTVKKFLDIAFSSVGLNYIDHIKFKKEFFRPSEKVALIGNPSKIQRDLKWKAQKPIQEIIGEMVQYDIAVAKGGK